VPQNFGFFSHTIERKVQDESAIVETTIGYLKWTKL